jgi:hypothetical protein
MAAMKIDLSKACDRVSWLYLHLVLLHIGFSLHVVKWIMSCVIFVSFIIFINGAISKFFKPSQGLRQGCPLSPYLFLLMVDGLSGIISEVNQMHIIQGFKVGRSIYLTRLLFIDDILIFCLCYDSEARSLNDILALSCGVTRMVIVDIMVTAGGIYLHV